MTELLFGTVAPVWPAPLPGQAWFQAPVAPGRAIGNPPGSPSAFGGGAANFMLPQAGIPFPQTTPDAGGITAPALLQAVAIRRGQLAGPTSDQDVEDFIYDALDLLPGATDVEVRCDSGRTTLTGTVSQKRLKRDIGEIAWTIPGINDVNNNITIAPRRRSRGQTRESEPPAVVGRKPA
jgi:hypothetical protein